MLTNSLDSVLLIQNLTNDILDFKISNFPQNLNFLNNTLSVFNLPLEVPVNDESAYLEFTDENLAQLGLTQADFLGLFPSESLSKLDHSPEANTFTDINLMHSLPTDHLDDYSNLEAIKSQYHSSVPLRKLQYPEPFIASASFIHTDIGFIHVLQYNYWLWFMFIWMIVFFFITFLCTVRWCNMRVKPRRETRGVSRSKCGDLITACVPITWAVSIIVTESTDASDFYDGFGAAEITIGVRAYQWGWEYYYPKNIDLNYNVKSSYSAFIGNSLKYTTASEKTRSNNNLWKFYQNKTSDEVLTPAHLLLLPLDNKKLVNFLDFNDIGSNTLKESMAFKKIKTISKTSNSNLVEAPSNLHFKYKKINQTYLNDNSFLLSNNYGLTRQHNLLSLKSNLNKNNVFLDKNSFELFLKNQDTQLQTSLSNENFYDNLLNVKKVNSQNSSSSVLSLSDITNYKTNLLSSLNLLMSYPTLLKTFNDNSDKTFFQYPLRKLFNSKLNELNTNNKELFNNITNEENSNVINTVDKFENNGTTKKTVTLLSSNQNIQPADQNLRQYDNTSANKTNFNLEGSTGLTINFDNQNLDSNYFTSKAQNVNETTFYKFMSNRTNLIAPYAPIFDSSNRGVTSLNYDASNTLTEDFQSNDNVTTPLTHSYRLAKSNNISILKGKRDGAPDFLNSTYWTMFWANTSPNLRFNSITESLKLNQLSYLPYFNNYYDYDFRNLQAYELLEDLVWENNYSAYSHYDYLNIATNATKTQDADLRTSMREPYFLNDNLELKLKKKPLSVGALKDLSLTGHYYTTTVTADDLLNPTNLTSESDFSLVPLMTTLFNIDDSYENWNEMRNIYSKNLNNTMLVSSSFYKPQSYLNVFNAFRADFEDFNWLSNSAKTSTETDLSNFENFNFNLLNTSNNDESQNLRISNPLTLRTTTRNSIVNFNALQKVFRARFEDGRSNATLNQFAHLSSTQPFLNTDRVAYESLLGKTKNNFFNVNFFTNNSLNILNEFSSSLTALNFQFFDFPFLLSAKSDMSRYMWFDWYAKWGLLEVGPSSVSRYMTIGVPYIKKSFSYNVESGESINEAETYLSRISRARKNYIPNWTYTPYLYMRSANWFNHNVTSSLTTNNEYTSVRLLLDRLKVYDSSLFFNNPLTTTFTPSNSGVSTYTKSTWRPYASTQSYYYTITTLIDYLSKREYLYRQYLELNNNSIHLPYELTATPTNPLLEDVKASFLFNDPNEVASEYSREIYYNSLDFFKYLLIKDWLVYLKDVPFNFTWLNDYLFFYLFGFKNSFKNGNVNELYKNPFRPMRKGVNSMLRLHATGAVAMPVEVRLQVLASSRDVIHSWSIPSAGVKIDCVPGYTSHKIMIFLMEGIYWGQCMEICGRYHHWMPIMVYFMRRDLFFLWCTHFIFNTNLTKVWDINDRAFTNYTQSLSHSKSSWILDLQQNL